MRARTTDEIFIAAPRTAILRRLTEISADPSWWPGARARGGYGWVEVAAPAGRPVSRVRFRAAIGAVRGDEGFTWTLERGELHGRAEWWLEAFGDGTIVHYYLDVERGDRDRWRRMSSVVRRHRWAIRRGLNALKDALEGRAAGATRPGRGSRPAAP